MEDALGSNSMMQSAKHDFYIRMKRSSSGITCCVQSMFPAPSFPWSREYSLYFSERSPEVPDNLFIHEKFFISVLA